MEIIIGVIIVVAMFALVNYTFYHLGQFVGRMRERERREGLEARIRQEIDMAARKDREIWETEIDA